MYNANAYTVGGDVVFAQGCYAPVTAIGRRLLAHELTHVLQQENVAAAHQLRVENTSWKERQAELRSNAIDDAARDNKNNAQSSPADRLSIQRQVTEETSTGRRHTSVTRRRLFRTDPARPGVFFERQRVLVVVEFDPEQVSPGFVGDVLPAGARPRDAAEMLVDALIGPLSPEDKASPTFSTGG